MAQPHENRIHQLEDIANKSTLHQGRYGELVKGELSSSSSDNKPDLIGVPVTLKAQLGSPVRIQYLCAAYIYQVTDFSADGICYRCVFDYFHNTVSVSDGVAWRYRHQCIHWQLLLRCRSAYPRDWKNELLLTSLQGLAWSYQLNGNSSSVIPTHILSFLLLGSSMVVSVLSSRRCSELPRPMEPTRLSITMPLASF